MKEVKPKTGLSCGHAHEHELWLSQFGGRRQFKDFQSYSEAEPRTGPDLVTTDRVLVVKERMKSDST